MIRSVPVAVLLAAALMLPAIEPPIAVAAADGSGRPISAEMFEFPREVGTVSAWTSITSTGDGQVIAGLCRNNLPAYLVQFDDRDEQFVAAVSVDTAIRDKGEWQVKQAKIHSQLYELTDGWVYGGTHLSEDADADRYAGGHWFRYDPKSHKMEDLGLAMAHEGLIAMQADPQRRCLYAITYPGAYLLRFDLVSRQTQVLGKTSRNDQVVRAFFLLKNGSVYANQVVSPASQPGGVYRLDPRTDSKELLLPSVYRKAMNRYAELVVAEGPRIYNYWLAGITNPARDTAYTTGYYSGHFVSLHLDDRSELVVHDHGPTLEDGYTDVHGPFSQGMCWVDGKVLFTVGVESAGPAKEGQVRLLQYDPARDVIEALGVVQTSDGTPVVQCTGMACTPSRRAYLLAKVSGRESVVLLRIDLKDVWPKR